MSKPKSLTFFIVLGGSLCLTLLFVGLYWQTISEWDALWQYSKQAEQRLIIQSDQPNSLESELSVQHSESEPASLRVAQSYEQHLSDKRQLFIRWSVAWLAALGLLLLMFCAARYNTRQQSLIHQADLEERHRESEQARELLGLITWAQAEYIQTDNQRDSFNTLLNRVLAVTESQFGFIGEVLQDLQGLPYLRTYAISNIAWDQASADFYSERADQGMEFHNLDTLFGRVIRDAMALITNTPSEDPRRGGLPPGHPPLEAFAGFPLFANGQMVGMLGIANRPGGYVDEFAEQLKPLLATLGQLIEALRRDIQRQQTQQSLQRQRGVDSECKHAASEPIHPLGSWYSATLAHVASRTVPRLGASSLSLAPRILMPPEQFDEMANRYSEENLREAAIRGSWYLHRAVVNSLVGFFKVSKQSAEIRLGERGYYLRE